MLHPTAMLWLILWSLSLPVDSANALAAWLLASDSPACERQWRRPNDCESRIRESLDAISDIALPREERRRARWYGVHAVDSHLNRKAWRKGHARGYLQDWCPFHAEQVGSTVGTHHMMFGINVQRLPVPCVPWQAFGLSFVSAYAAGVRYLEMCHGEPTGRSWCPKRGAVVRARRRRG